VTPPAHFLASWLAANCGGANRRDRAIITVAGLLPDLDGLGYFPEWLTASTAHPVFWYSNWHHILFHNALAGIICAAAALALAKQRWKAALLARGAFHLHLLMDLAGARGPDGDQWAIPYLLPCSEAWQWTWSGQWALDSWINRAIGVALLAAVVGLARWRGFSPFEMISPRADGACIGLLRRWLPGGKPAGVRRPPPEA